MSVENPLENVSKKETPEERENIELEISEKALIESLSSADFLKALKISGFETYKSGYETSFKLYISKEGSMELGEISKGGTDNMGEGPHEIISQEREGLLQEVSKGKVKDFAHLHFHPEPEGAIMPSEEDLIIMKQLDLDIEIICRIGTDKDIDALLLKLGKNIHPNELSDLVNCYYDELSKNGITNTSGRGDDATVQKILRDNGVENVMISYEFNRKTKKYTLSKESKEKIKKFGGLKIKI